MTNETESKKSFTHEDKANLTLHFQALVSGNILDACLGRAHGREVRSLKHALSKFDHERQQSSAVEAYRNLFRVSECVACSSVLCVVHDALSERPRDRVCVSACMCRMLVGVVFSWLRNTGTTSIGVCAAGAAWRCVVGALQV